MWYFLKIPPQVERMGLRMALWLSGSFDFGSSCGAEALRAEALTTHAALFVQKAAADVVLPLVGSKGLPTSATAPRVS